MLRFKNFLNDESGAVAVDWVVITAAIVGLNMLLVVGVIVDGVEVVGTEIDGKVSSVGATFMDR
ncbi:MAG: hypothetical protein AAGE76_09665 [Pseudomonadota bacterium]